MGHRDLLVTHTILLALPDYTCLYPREASAAPAASFSSPNRRLKTAGPARSHKEESGVIHPSGFRPSTEGFPKRYATFSVAPPGRRRSFRTRPFLPPLWAVAGDWIRLGRLRAAAFGGTRRSGAVTRSEATVQKPILWHATCMAKSARWCGIPAVISLDNKMPMKYIFLALAALCCGSVSAIAQISPGPLSRAHAGLEGPTKCASCHSFGLGTRKFKCTNCHGEIAQRIAASQGFHARVAKNSPGNQDCARCHTEHFGPKFNIVKWEPSRDDFDHRQTGYVLQGKHAKVACERCHNAGHVLPAERKNIRVKGLGHTYLGLSPQCGTCHADEHRAQLGPDCARCHTFQAWKPTAGFEHSATKFALTGLHQKVACAQCHRTLTEEGKTFAKYNGIPFAACSNCHKDVHNGAFQGDCQSCHNTSGWKQVTMSVNFDHNRTQFPLHGSHAKVACFKCHSGSDFKQSVAHAQCAN